MKKIFLIFASAALIVACGQKGGNTEAQDSARIADSLEQARIADSIALAQQAQLIADSLEQVRIADSIAAAETAAKKPATHKPAATTSKPAVKEEVKQVVEEVKEAPKTPSSPAERNAAIAKEKEEAVKNFRNK